ncbi:MAG: acyltransferase [Candidatus Nanopelagicales bacterium]
MGASLAQRVAAASRGRDRVLDAAKTVALVVVVIGHSLAWHVTPANTAANVLESERWLVALTWAFQVLPLFFAAGAVSNAASLRRHGTRDYLVRRSRGLVTPVLIYATLWTVVLLPFGAVSEPVIGAGRFLSQLLWFAGVYLLVSAAAPITARWAAARPLTVLVCWLVVIAAVDAVRWADGPGWIGWLNLLLVWGWLHQLGYSLPALRRQRPPLLAAGAAALFAVAVALALLGPYSSSLVTVGGDPELSNLSPPTLVLALYGAGQVLLLAALWPVLTRFLANDRRWAIVALVGARGIGIYLWHIPLVGIAAGLALLLHWSVQPLGLWWWIVHLLVMATVLPLAWLIAGGAGAVGRRLDRVPRVVALPVWLAALGAGAVVLNISVTGFATWSGTGMLGLWSSAALNLVLLALCWQAVGPPRGGAAAGHPAPPAGEG